MLFRSTWRTLGKILPESKKIFDNNRTRTIEIHNNNLMIFQTQLMFYWLDFEKNQLGHLNARENDKLGQVWLAFYNNDKTKSQTMFQFNLGNELYYVKMSEDLDLQWTKTTIDLSVLSKEDVIPIYDNKVSILQSIGLFVNKHKNYFFIGIILILVFISVGATIFRKQKVPKELTNILYQNFYNAINIVEKELIEALFETNARGEELSTKAINKIIGVQQKDTLTQNKSRSDHFIKINQKFKMATQNTEPLIIKNRDKADKRQYNYDINEMYIEAIEKLLKE